MSMKIVTSLQACIVFSLLFTFVYSFDIVKRSEWGARPPKGRTVIPRKLTHVIIHHTYQPAACFTKLDCVRAMKWMQDFHQIERQWDDIGYSYAIGGDGNIYEGRGFNIVGAHAPGYNDKSIGITLIGDWRTIVPPTQMLEATKSLISFAIQAGHLDCDYILHGHMQVRDTECPGAALYNEIQTWPHWAPVKNSTKV